jgi:hypothetical protein
MIRDPEPKTLEASETPLMFCVDISYRFTKSYQFLDR